MGNPCYKVAKNLAELCSSVLWKIELLSNETGYLAEKMSMQSVEGATWFLLTAFMVKYERPEHRTSWESCENRIPREKMYIFLT